MNYFKQLNEFYSTLDYKPLSANAIAVYMILLHIANKTGWIDEFKVANSILMSKCSLSISSLQRARNELIVQDYISYKKGLNQNDAPRYKITNLYFEQADEQADEQPPEQAGEQADEQPGEYINKHNRTKHKNKLNEFNLYNNFDENVGCDCISKSTKQKCGRRSTYNINGMNYCNQHSKSIISKYLGKKGEFIPPSLEDVKSYVLEKKLNIDAEFFYNYFTEGNWLDKNGKPVLNWKQKLITWNSFNKTEKPKEEVKEKSKQNEIYFNANDLTEEQYILYMQGKLTNEDIRKILEEKNV